MPTINQLIKKNRVKTIAEPNQYGWYHVQEKNKEPITKPVGTFPIKLPLDFGSNISPRRRRFKKWVKKIIWNI